MDKNILNWTYRDIYNFSSSENELKQLQFTHLDLIPLYFDSVKIGANWSEFSQAYLPFLQPDQDFLRKKNLKFKCI